MHIHEYQAKALLKQYGISVPEYIVISDPNELNEVMHELKWWEKVVVKIQVHAGGRGKAGGVKIANNGNELKEIVQNLLGMKMVNNQTGKEGIIAKKVLISPLIDIQKEYYLCAAIDRQKAKGVLIASTEGGMEIEEIAKKSPEKIIIAPIERLGFIRSYHMIEILKMMGWKGNLEEEGRNLINSLTRLFADSDAELIEINPLVLTKENKLVALDAKMTVDDNALFRQPLIAKWHDPSQLPIYEAVAKEHDLAYVAMDGNIGCMVNGAGLAMATMDIIHYFGGAPANFLDVGGGASQSKISEGFKIILSDPKVKSILINIFGGIMNCVTLAAGIISAATELKLQIPLIIRMEGTNVEKGKQLFIDSDLDIIITESLSEAAERAVLEAKRNS